MNCLSENQYGYVNNSYPSIKNIMFPNKNNMKIELEDGRKIDVPLLKFPVIKKLNPQDKKYFMILDDSYFTFRNCVDIYHISQILGTNYPNSCL